MHFHAPPTIATFPIGKFILGTMPWIPYTPEKFIEICALYENQLNERIKEHKVIEKSMTTKQVEVVSNSDATKKYLVTIYGPDSLTCDCKGFGFRGRCSHVDKVKESL